MISTIYAVVCFRTDTCKHGSELLNGNLRDDGVYDYDPVYLSKEDADKKVAELNKRELDTWEHSNYRFRVQPLSVF